MNCFFPRKRISYCFEFHRYARRDIVHSASKSAWPIVEINPYLVDCGNTILPTQKQRLDDWRLREILISLLLFVFLFLLFLFLLIVLVLVQQCAACFGGEDGLEGINVSMCIESTSLDQGKPSSKIVNCICALSFDASHAQQHCERL